MLYIDVPDLNDSFSRAVLDGKEILLRFTFNVAGGYWCFGVYDTEESPVLTMAKVVPNFPLTFFYGSLDLPSGIFGALSDLERIGRDDFKNGKAQFVFIPISDLEE